jgi:hypothetical protein
MKTKIAIIQSVALLALALPLAGGESRRFSVHRAWELCTLFDINLQPKNTSLAELQSGFLGLAKQLYSAEETQTRRANFKRMLRTSPNFGRLARREEHWLVA